MMPVIARRLASVSAFSYCRRFRFFISLNTESATKRPRSISNALGWPTDERRSGRRPVLGEPIACRYLRITAAFSLTNAYDNPTPRHEAAASTKKSLILAWRPGAQICATSIAAANVRSSSFQVTAALHQCRRRARAASPRFRPLRHGCGYALANAGHDTRALPQEHPAHGALYRTRAGPLQEFLAGLSPPPSSDRPRAARVR